MPKAKPAGREARFALRMPEKLQERLRRSAEQNHRSINAEIIVILEKTLGTDK